MHVVDAVFVEHRGGFVAVGPELDGPEEDLRGDLHGHVQPELLVDDHVSPRAQDEELRDHDDT